MQWKSQPCKEHPRKTILLIIFLVALGIGIYFSFSWYWVIIAYILVGGGILPYFLPTYYSLENEGMTIKGIVIEKKKQWEDFKTYYKDKNGVLLSPFDKPSRLENFRGTYIRFNDNEKEVIDFISTRIEEPQRTQSP
ncbi:hypothetical protein KAW65_08915 [candidate division WOR-3 bacterium]|nr:hypothetical protein [candidate division WOR-3 bacterium]